MQMCDCQDTHTSKRQHASEQLKNLLLCFVLLEANKMSAPSVLGEGFCWQRVLLLGQGPGSRALGLVPHLCS